ncbi:MAG: type II toxin-antitoxin system RelE/ParE family toxin [Candidatus Schekmanbacteria bacterium]|nr:type II toxin-antitoxin system RelE/ParE family toxin [Candidatus Schekmanbacteria bacterium]
MKVKILASAGQDLIDGYWFYEKQAEGLGTFFIDTLFSDIDSLSIYGGIHPKYFGRYFRLLSRRFPFAIYYCVEDNTVLIYAILDCRRNPAWIRNKLRKV